MPVNHHAPFDLAVRRSSKFPEPISNLPETELSGTVPSTTLLELSAIFPCALKENKRNRFYSKQHLPQGVSMFATMAGNPRKVLI